MHLHVKNDILGKKCSRPTLGVKQNYPKVGLFNTIILVCCPKSNELICLQSVYILSF